MTRANTAADLMALVEKRDDGCWEWMGVREKRYAKWAAAGEVWAHRSAYALLVGPIPDGHEVDHLCFFRFCVNPAHLEAVTKQENMRRWSEHVRSTTPHGTHSRYHHGCRCALCLAARAAYVREHRRTNHSRLIAGEVDPQHGSYSTYTNYLCRCEVCKTANRLRQRRRKAAQRQAA